MRGADDGDTSWGWLLRSPSSAPTGRALASVGRFAYGPDRSEKSSETLAVRW
jgi:hypothetical protein